MKKIILLSAFTACLFGTQTFASSLFCVGDNGQYRFQFHFSGDGKRIVKSIAFPGSSGFSEKESWLVESAESSDTELKVTGVVADAGNGISGKILIRGIFYDYPARWVVRYQSEIITSRQSSGGSSGSGSGSGDQALCSYWK